MGQGLWSKRTVAEVMPQAGGQHTQNERGQTRVNIFALTFVSKGLMF